jgi:hypothetical protein
MAHVSEIVNTLKSSKKATPRGKAGFRMAAVTSLLRRTADTLDGPDKMGAFREADRLIAELTKDERAIARAVALGMAKRIEAA